VEKVGQKVEKVEKVGQKEEKVGKKLLF